MLDRIIRYSFYLLFLITPLFWTSLNYELFEYNKMILTYGLTIVIVGTWILKMVYRKSFIVNRTPLDIPLLLFLGANILSTIFSIDHHTSIWGYYSRSNGGLLSLVSYLLLYWAFVSNMTKEQVLTTLKFGLISGFIIAIWAIFEHFGTSFSCVILRGEFNDSCWIQDVQARVFASLGQPNWLAAYLGMLIFPALYFLMTAKSRLSQTTYYLLLTTLYLGFTFTYSRGPTLGLIGGLAVFIFFYFIADSTHIRERFFAALRMTRISGILLSFILVNILFGSALTSFRLVSKFAAPSRPAIELASGGSQLENGGTESGQIRLIVWQGAIDIFRHYPILGSGVETFAYSYYQFRPAAHNLTSEWDFLYNKAHNEYLNYLATTGIVGFGTYMIMIICFVYWCIRFLVTSKKTTNSEQTLMTAALLGAYVLYLIYNFFLFSVVILAIFFYLFPAFVFVFTDSIKPLKLPKKLFTIHYSLFTSFIYRRSLYTKIALGLIIFVICYLLFGVYKLWLADTIFSSGNKASDAGNPGRAYNLFSSALDLNPGEPFYRSELAYSAAAASSALAETDATLSAALRDEAVIQTKIVLQNSPKNVSFYRTAIRTYFELATEDPGYIDKTLQALDQAIILAPTDPKLYYNKALILQSQNKKPEAIAAFQKAIELKPNYLEAIASLKQATASANTK